MLAEELVPGIGERYRVTKDARGRALMGIGGYGVAALYGAFQHPEVFGNAAVQSISLRQDAAPALLEMVGDGRRRDVQLYLDWNVWEDRSVDRGYDLRQDGLELSTLLVENAYTFSGGEVNDSAGWAGWRARTHRILEVFFPRR
jgi:enterochelin esterase-like enzyme